MYALSEVVCQNEVSRLLKRQSSESPRAGLQYELFVHGKGHQLISMVFFSFLSFFFFFFKEEIKLAALLKFKYIVHRVIIDEILEKWTNYTQCT